MRVVPLEKRFTLFTNLLFRGTLLLFGWWPPFSHWLKGHIRKALMLSARPAPVRFKRTLTMESGKIVIFDEIWLDGATMVMKAVIGDDFMARHVPQSRYFQISELSLKGYTFSSAEIQELNQKRHLSIRREVVGSSYKPGGS